MGVSRIRLTIGRLVLRGFDPGTHEALVDGLQSELSRVLVEPKYRAEWARSHRTPVLRLERMLLGPGLSGARKFGGGVARAIRRGLKP